MWTRSSQRLESSFLDRQTVNDFGDPGMKHALFMNSSFETFRMAAVGVAQAGVACFRAVQEQGRDARARDGNAVSVRPPMRRE
jgi:hypothetical protein